MAHNSKRNHRHTAVQDGDDYVYPTAKIRETKTRSRNHDKTMIRKGLVDIENQSFDDFEEDINDLAQEYDDKSIASNDDIAAEFGDNADPKDLFNPFDILEDINTNWDHRWEDY